MNPESTLPKSPLPSQSTPPHSPPTLLHLDPKSPLGTSKPDLVPCAYTTRTGTRCKIRTLVPGTPYCKACIDKASRAIAREQQVDNRPSPRIRSSDPPKSPPRSLSEYLSAPEFTHDKSSTNLNSPSEMSTQVKTPLYAPDQNTVQPSAPSNNFDSVAQAFEYHLARAQDPLLPPPVPVPEASFTELPDSLNSFGGFANFSSSEPATPQITSIGLENVPPFNNVPNYAPDAPAPPSYTPPAFESDAANALRRYDSSKLIIAVLWYAYLKMVKYIGVWAKLPRFHEKVKNSDFIKEMFEPAVRDQARIIGLDISNLPPILSIVIATAMCAITSDETF